MSDPAFNEQAYLLWKKFVVPGSTFSSKFKHGIIIGGSAGYIPLHRLVGSYDPVAVISKILKPKNSDTYHGLLNLETYKLNALVPDIKLFKIFNGKYYPFYFPTAVDSVDSRRIITSGGTLHGAGIKGFDVRFVGKDMFTRDKLIECSLTFYVESLEIIFKEPPGGYAKIADLFTISRKNQTTTSEGVGKEVPANLIKSPSSFEIAATLGYHTPKAKDLFKQSEIDAIENSHLSLRMTMNEHSIAVNPDGSATIDVKYHARLSGLLSDGPFDTMTNSAMNILEGVADIRAQHELSSRGIKPDSTQGKKVKKTTDRKIKTATTEVFKDYLNQLFDSGRVKTLDVGPKEMKEFRKYQRMVSTKDEEDADAKSTNIGDGRPSKSSNTAPQTNSLRPGKCAPKAIRARSANFILLGDLIEVVLRGVKTRIGQAQVSAKKELKTAKKKRKKTLDQRLKYLNKAWNQFSTFKVILARVPICVGDKKFVNINVSDIPISLSLYYTWIFSRVTQMNKHKYTVEQFLDDCITYLIVNALDGAATNALKFIGNNNASIKSLSMTGGNLSSMQKRHVDIKIKQMPDFLKRIPAKNLKDEIDYYIIYAEPTPQSPASRKGDLAKDVTDGIYHFHLGHDRGMLKNASFSKFEVGSMRESLMVNSVSLYDELRMPYTATLTLFGNNLFLPGSMIYINPASIGFGDPRNKRSAAVRLGFGGYYTVLNVHTTLTGNELVTILQTSYVSWADSASSLMSELADRTKKTEDSRPNATPGAPTLSDTPSESRPSVDRSVGRQSDTAFIMSDSNLTELEKAAVVAIYIYGTDSEQFRRADDASGDTVYRIEESDKPELTRPRSRRARPNSILVQVKRPFGATFIVRRSGADASVKSEE